MRCGKVTRSLSPYLDERLEEAHRREVDAHLAECKACREKFSLMRAARTALRAEGPAEVPEGLARRAADAALTSGRAARKERGPGLLEQLVGLRWPVAVTAAAAAAAALLLMVNVKLAGPSTARTQDQANESVAYLVSADDAGLDRSDMVASVLAEEEE